MKRTWLAGALGLGTLVASAALADAPPPAAPAPAPDANFTLDTSRSSVELALGAKGRLSIIINPGAGRKVHDQAPLTVNLKATKGLTLSKTKLGHADVVNKGDRAPELAVDITATAAGTQVTEAEMQFFICTEKWCERQMQRVTITTAVK